MAQGTFNIAANADDGKWITIEGSFANNNNTENLGRGYVETNLFFRFSSIIIPKKATIINAYITLNSDGSNALPVPVDIYAVDADNPTAPANNNDCLLATPTTASVYWNITSWSTVNQTPDIKSVIQELVNRDGWVSGNAALVLFKLRYGDTGYGKYALVYMGELSSGIYKATLDVEWSESSGAIKVGSSSVSKIYVGSSEVQKVYVGSNQIWSK